MAESDLAIQGWVGRTETREECLSAFSLAAMAATLDQPAPLIVPPLWHWLYFLPLAPASSVGVDGHPALGGFLPPVALPRRMWAGGRLTFHNPLYPGKPANKSSTIASITEKNGSNGRLVFVTVTHKIISNDTTCIEEEQDIVYRDHPLTTTKSDVRQPASAPRGETWSRRFSADPVLLFRYSALTFNGHRIHYDQPYVTLVEGYPGLVVHGPLIATLLLDLFVRNAPGALLKSFSFRAIRPVFSNNDFVLCGSPSADGKTVDLWAKDHDGFLAMQATVTLA